MMSLAKRVPGKPAVVLVEPQEGGNIGAAARAMANMGLSRLLLVRPANHMGAEAERMSVGGKSILLGAEVFGCLEEAVADFDFVVGTTRREGSIRQERVTPKAAAAEIGRRGGGKTALVFGRERSGLTNREVDVCHRLVTIPASSDNRSLNLAQAVLVLAYEILLVSEPSATAGLKRAGRNAAVHGELEGMYAHMERVLLRVGYFHDENPQRMMRSFRKMLDRASLDSREVRAVRGIFHQVEWYCRQRDQETGGAADIDKGK
jgi:TrmH family RNA methyltransferase